MEEYNFIIHGEKEYSSIMSEIDSVCGKFLAADSVHYIYAIKEACLNALDNCSNPVNIEITVDVCVFDTDIVTIVSADTNGFSPEAIRDRYRRLLLDEKYRGMDWGDYESSLPITEQHRGIWYMLTACDYLYFTADGKKVTLIAKYPFQEEHFTTKIGPLIYRFLIEKNGVIG